MSATLETILPVTGIISSFAFFLSPIPTVLKLRKEGQYHHHRTSRLRDDSSSTAAVSPSPSPLHSTAAAAAAALLDNKILSHTTLYIAQAINCLFWITYSYLMSRHLVIVPNLFGLTLSCLYLYICFNTIENVADGDRLITRITIGLVVFCAALAYVTFVVDIRSVANTFGLFSAITNIIMFASPLVNMRAIVRSRDSRPISWLTVVTALGNTLSWYLYGVIIGDTFTIKCNGIGALLVLVQLVVKLVCKWYAGASQSDERSSGDQALQTVVVQSSRHKNLLD